MAEEDLGSIHDMLTCPYNQSHRVGASKFAKHLVNCRLQNPELAKQMMICNYNQTHHVRAQDMEEHLKNCRDFSNFQLHVLNQSSSHMKNPNVNVSSNGTSFQRSAAPRQPGHQNSNLQNVNNDDPYLNDDW